jgi:hypothetical protein
VILKKDRRKKVFLALFLLVAAFAMVWGRAVYGSRRAYEQGEMHARADDPVKAVTFFDRAIRWYAPFNPYVEASANRLWEMGLRAAEKGDHRMALMAFQTLRRGFFAARGLYGPGQAWIRKCDEKIYDISGTRQHRTDSDGQEIETLNASSMSPETMPPHPWWSLAVVGAFMGWVASVLGFIVFGMKDGSTPCMEWGRALPWGFGIGVFFALWIWSVMQA